MVARVDGQLQLDEITRQLSSQEEEIDSILGNLASLESVYASNQKVLMDLKSIEQRIGKEKYLCMNKDAEAKELIKTYNSLASFYPKPWRKAEWAKIVQFKENIEKRRQGILLLEADAEQIRTPEVTEALRKLPLLEEDLRQLMAIRDKVYANIRALRQRRDEILNVRVERKESDRFASDKSVNPPATQVDAKQKSPSRKRGESSAADALVQNDGLFPSDGKTRNRLMQKRADLLAAEMRFREITDNLRSSADRRRDLVALIGSLSSYSQRLNRLHQDMRRLERDRDTFKKTQQHARFQRARDRLSALQTEINSTIEKQKHEIRTSTQIAPLYREFTEVEAMIEATQQAHHSSRQQVLNLRNHCKQLEKNIGKSKTPLHRHTKDEVNLTGAGKQQAPIVRFAQSGTHEWEDHWLTLKKD